MYKDKIKRFDNRHKKLLDLSDLPNLSEKLKKSKKKTVFTLGSFNLLNPGHCRYLADAKAMGDVLIAGVTSDFSEKVKNEQYPLISEEIRKEMLAFLRVVDYVVTVDEKNPYDILLLLKPNIFVTTQKSWKDGIRTKNDLEVARMTKTKIVIRDVVKPYYSIGQLVDHIANIRVIQILEVYLKEKVRGFALNPNEDLQPADFGNQKPNIKSAFDPNPHILNVEKLSDLRKKHKDKKISFVAGSFDLLHIGHARFIEQAGLCGDILVVGVPSDAVIRYTKGVGRPIISERSRAYTLCHLDSVDNVVIFDGGTVMTCLEALKPDVFYTVAEEWNKGYKKSAEYKFVKSYGGEIVLGPRQAINTSSSAIIDKLAQKKVREIFRECMDESKYLKILQEQSKLKNGKK